MCQINKSKSVTMLHQMLHQCYSENGANLLIYEKKCNIVTVLQWF